MSTGFGTGRRVIADETQRVLDAVDAEAWNRVAAQIMRARSIYVIGSGRSGLAGQMAAMRLMHLGLRVHVAGEVTAPAIGAHDLLLAVSGSGTTAGVVCAADTARRVGASVVAITTALDSPLARRADEVLHLAGTDKQDRSGSVSRQYAGSLFEQSVLLAFDAQFHALWNAGDQSAEELWDRHANIG